jgi:iron complex outermembrane recepter protein
VQVCCKLIFCLLLICVPYFSATNAVGSLSGTVQDAAGMPIRDARVLLKGLLDSELVTDAQGIFRVRALPLGTYRLTVEKSGFSVIQQTIVLSPEKPSSEILLTAEPATLLQVMEVTGAPDLVGEAVMKLSSSLHETPRAASVFDSDQLRDRNVRSIPELLAFVPGMSPNSLRTGGYHFYARGFRMAANDTRVDGFAGVNLAGGFGASTFGIEQAVILRGPAGLQYGANGSPGGFINLITKKPQPLRSTRLDLRGGSFWGSGVSLRERPSLSFDFDSTGAVTRGGRILYRTLFTTENNNYFTRNVLDKGRYYNASMTFKLDPLGLYSITPIFQYTTNLRPSGGGIVVSPSTSLSTNDGSFGPINLRDLSPNDVNLSTGFQNYIGQQMGFDFRAVPVERWTFALSYRAIRNDRHINQFTPQVSSAAQINLLRTQNLVNRIQSVSDADNRYQNLDLNTSYELKGSSWKSTMQVGAYTLITNTRSTAVQGTPLVAGFPINIYTGVAVRPVDAFPRLLMSPFAATTNWNSYFQNRTSLLRDRLVLSAGLGYGQSHPSDSAVRKGDLMPNFSAVFNFTRTVAIYGSYSTSFNPVDPTLQDITGRMNVFNPTIGRNYEVGTKFDLPNRRLSTTFSLFKNNINNALVQAGINDINPNGLRYYVEAGTRRGQGAEWSTDFRLLRDFYVSGAVSYTDAIYTGTGPASATSTLAIPGSKAEKTPKWAWNSRLNYQRSEGRLAGFGGSFTLLWQDERLGSNGARTFAAPDPLMLPAYTRADASVSYRFSQHLDVALNMENLTDRRIFLNATTGSSIELAPPRTATMRMSYRF